MFNIKYIELKTGWSDDGPAWIGHVKESRSGSTLYFNDHAFQRCRGASGNYVDVETGGRYCRGATIADRNGVTGNQPNCRCVVDLDRERFVDALVEACSTFEGWEV